MRYYDYEAIYVGDEEVFHEMFWDEIKEFADVTDDKEVMEFIHSYNGLYDLMDDVLEAAPGHYIILSVSEYEEQYYIIKVD